MVRRRYVRPSALFAAVIMTLGVATLGQAGGAGAKDEREAQPQRSSGDIRKIDHVLVLMQENRSYDDYLSRLHFQGQPRSAVESQKPNRNPLGGPPIHPFLKDSPCEVADLDHSWNGTHREWNGGRMDGFTAANVNPADPTGSRAMGYYDSKTLPFYYGIANEFSTADRYFASVLTQTFPNRFYLLTGTSFGHIRNDVAIFTQKTIFQALDEARPAVSWKIYLASFQVELLFSYVAQHAAGHVFPISQYFTDAANGTLPQVSFLESDPFGDKNTESDEHPPANVQVGQKFTHDAMSALVNSPDWSSSAFFLVYDEHGGFYDHVSPPPAPPPDNIPPMLQPGDTPGAFDRYGIRVPALVVSPYAKAHHVSHTVYDHTSILKFIETRFGLPALTRRDAAADPMLDMFDFTRVSHPHPVLPDAPVDAAGIAACNALP
jgi:phospholipase C